MYATRYSLLTIRYFQEHEPWQHGATVHRPIGCWRTCGPRAKESPPRSARALTGADPVLPSSFKVGTAAQATIAAAGLAAAELWRLRTGREQTVAVDMRHAAIEFRSERYMRLDGRPPGPAWNKIAGVYATGDGRKVRLRTTATASSGCSAAPTTARRCNGRC